jgi:hypothetical protein
MSLLYKPLFEVKLLHEFFVTNSEGDTPFGEPLQSKRLEFLSKAFEQESPSIDGSIQAELVDWEGSEQAKNIRVIPSFSGFKVFVHVNRKRLSDGSEVYEPFFAINDTTSFSIRLTQINNGIDAYTNSRLDRPFPAIYCFSNRNSFGTKTAPFLTSPVQPIDTSRVYEQGELVNTGAGLEQFYVDKNGDEQWNPIDGSQFISETDRCLLPLRFKYRFSQRDALTKASFTLKDKNGVTIHSLLDVPAAPGQSYQLDFSSLVSPLTENGVIDDHIYSLQVASDTAFLFKGSVVFSDVLYKPGTWGIVHMNAAAPVSAFNLLSSDGLLHTRKNASGVRVDPPVFEIPIKSRLGYWRYKNNHGYELKLLPELGGYLFKRDGFLQTNLPRPSASGYVMLSNDSIDEKKFLPNPSSYAAVQDEFRRVCFDIRIPESGLFPVIK